MESSLISIIPNLLFLIPQIIIIVACFINLNHRKSASGILLLIGAITNLLAFLFNSIAVPILMQQANMDMYSRTVDFLMISTPVSFIGSILFAIGLLLLIQEKTKAQQSA